MTTMTTIMNKRTYVLLILLCLLVATTTQAQIYSTANYRGASSYRNTTAAEASFHNTPSFSSTSSMRLHSTASQSIHTYGGSSSTAYGYNTSRGIIRTKATAVTGGSLVDNVGYIAINPRKTVMNEATFTNTDIENTGLTSNDNGYIDDDDTLPPPQFAPLSFSWDAILLMLLLACAYAIHIKVRSKKAKTRNYLKYLE